MSEQQRRIRHIPRTSVRLPIPKETPTLRLGSMLQVVRDQSKPTPKPRQCVSPERAAPLHATEMLDALDRVPRRHLPLFVCSAGLALLALAGVAWPNLKAPSKGFVAMPVDYANQAAIVEPANAAAESAALPGLSPGEKTAVEIVTTHRPHTLSSLNQAEPSTRRTEAIPKRPGHSESSQSSRSSPLRGYAWSPSANGLVRIEDGASPAAKEAPNAGP